MDDKQLENTLLELTRNICDTMEFNFYGSFLINPALIKEVSVFDESKNKSYTLNMEECIASLQRIDLQRLAEVQKKIPELFQSYRFIDHLLSQSGIPEIIRDNLQECRGKIELPLWRQRIKASLLEGEEIKK